MYITHFKHTIESLTGILVIILLIGCNKEPYENSSILNLDNYDPITKAMFFENLKPDKNYNCYEIRNAFCNSEDYQTIYSYNTNYLNSSDTAIHTLFDTIRPYNLAFLNPNCLPWCCHYYIVTIMDKQVSLCYNETTLKDFIGIIDSKSDALFWAFSHGYFFRLDDVSHGGILIFDNKYYIYSYQIKQTSIDWITTKGYIIEINRNAEIKIIKEFQNNEI